MIRLLGSRAQREKDLKAFERELAIVCSLRHPNIVCVYGAVFRPTELWLVMDLAEEGNLREYIEALSGKEDLSVELENRLDFARGCTAALAFLHGKDIQHRDVKSPNVLLARNSRGRLVAKVFYQNASHCLNFFGAFFLSVSFACSCCSFASCEGLPAASSLRFSLEFDYVRAVSDCRFWPGSIAAVLDLRYRHRQVGGHPRLVVAGVPEQGKAG